MEVVVRYATTEDLNWLKDKDKQISHEVLKKKLLNKEILMAQNENNMLGWLRFGFFWDAIPFMNMLFVNDTQRGQGIGRHLVEFWEKEMQKQGHTTVMTSSQSNEDAQHFYRKSGYVDIGGFTLPNEPREIVFIKKI